MSSFLKKINIPLKELIFQILLHALVFTFYTFDKNDPGVETYQYFFFLNYAFWAFVINYVLLPNFYYKKKYIHFLIGVFIVLVGAIVVEEAVVEKIFFPDSRGRYFIGTIVTLLAVMPIIIILSGFKFAWDALMKQEEVDQLKANIQESELQFLKSQINPHFLFNNLNNLYSYAIENSPKTPGIILELSSLLRYMLYECKEPFVPLEKELENLKNFTQLSEMQIEERGTVNFSTNVSDTNFRIAPLILIVFLENAFKHSTASQTKNINIDISIDVNEKGLLNFTCSNTYQKTTNIESLSKGIGLQNVRKRLDLLYPDKHAIDIQDTDEIYKVKLNLQLTKEN